MSMSEWAKREVEIACERERLVSKEENEWDYGCACYESALKAFNSLCEDGHSGYSIQLTKSILDRLIDGKPLTPIEDTEDVWNDISDISGLRGEKVNYQCKRMGSLFKDVYADGTVKYSDVERILCVDEHNSKNTWFSGKVCKVIDELIPITMPYMPDSKPIKVYCEELLTDHKNGDFDTLGILYAIMPDGKQIDIDKFFKESENGWDEINMDEYNERIEKHQERIKREMEEGMVDICE